MDLGKGAIDTPLGRMVVTASEQGVRRIDWGDGGDNDSSIGMNHIEAARDWIRAFFQRREADAPELDISGLTTFQRKVLTTLTEVAGFGDVVSYSELAAASGCENSGRAVGSVMARNPWVLLVPCHRVIRQDGVIGNYSGCNGSETKAWLLKHEGRELGPGLRVR